jgi:hypothetical protein
MKPLSSKVFYLDDDFRPNIAATAPGFLGQLEGLTVFDLKGEDQSRTRVVTTLIHGNEPSGFIASHLWLRSDAVPATNIRIIFCNVEAAQQKPIFTRRYVGESGDLNRYFGEGEMPDPLLLKRAQLIEAAIREVDPEAIIDLHNTSGLSPAFGVAIAETSEVMDLTSIFATKLIYTGLTVGALMEVKFDAPIVTIECGGAIEIMSHQVATDGLNAFFKLKNLFVHTDREVTIHRCPIRLELTGDASVGYASHRLLCTDITLIPELESFNRQPTSPGEFLGWWGGDERLPLQAIDEHKVDQIDNILTVEAGRIYTSHSIQMFMATTNQEIATNDCICYLTL